MTETVVALLSLMGTLVGSLGGIMVTQKLTSYRLDKLEEAVKESNKIVNRVFELEKHNEIQDTRLTSIEDEQDRLITDIRNLKNRNDRYAN